MAGNQTMDRPSQIRLFGVAQLSWRLNRDQLLFLFTAVNLGFLIFDVWISHSINAFRPVYEWIPILATPPGIVTSFWLAVAARPSRVALWGHAVAMLIGIGVGVLGLAFHLAAAVAPAGPVSWAWIIFSAPVLAPLSFAGVSLVGLVTAMQEDPPGSGQLSFAGGVRLRAPISKTQHLLWLLGLGLLGAAGASFIDHAQYGYSFYKWIPVVFGLFAAFVVLGLAVARRASPVDEGVYLWSMVACMIVGVLGFGFHLSRDMAETGALTFQRMQTFAPIAAPMLFADLGLLGLLVAILPAAEEPVAVPA